MQKLLMRNKYLILLFVLSTGFFVYQHAVNFSWDFSVYALNANHWLGDSYYEMPTPPLMSLVLFLLGAGKTAEYLYIILVSALFVYGAIRFSKASGLNKEIFYAFLLSAPLVFYAFINGTELLSLLLLVLFLALWIENKSYAPILLGLSVLARYNMIVFLPMVFLNRSLARIAKNLVFFTLPLVPWLLYNFLSTGNMLTTIADVYALSFKYRFYINQPVNYLHIIEWLGVLMPLFLIGLHSRLLNTHKGRSTISPANKISVILVIIIIALVIFQYIPNPVKNPRYLFNLALPVAYFSCACIERVRKRRDIIFIVSAVIILNAALLLQMNFSVQYEKQEKYIEAIDGMKGLNASSCRTFTNAWPLMNYLGKNSETYRPKDLLQRNIDEGVIMLFFYGTNDPDWAENKTFLRQFPVAYENDKFIILGRPNSCAVEKNFTHGYVSLFKENTLLIYNVTINSNPCFVLFSSNSIVESACNFINLNGFKTDKNREDGINLKDINSFYLSPDTGQA